MKYRVSRVFSINHETGFPQINYMLQQKKFLQRWDDVQMYVKEAEAERAKAKREKR